MSIINLSNIEQLSEIDSATYEEIISTTVKKLISNKQTITAAESLTAGMFISSIASVPGVSAILDGSFVTYANSAKIDLLDIDPKLVSKYGVVSAEIAKAMATQSRNKLNSQIGIGLTGVAGPDSLENQPAGTVYIGISIGKEDQAYKFSFSGNRELIRKKAVLSAILLIDKRINQN